MKPTLWDFAVAIAIVAAMVWLANWDPFGSKRKLKAQVTTAVAQSGVDTATVKAVDTHHVETIIIREKADHAVQQVSQAPGADEPLPPAVLDVWRSGIGELRQLDAGPSDPPSRDAKG